MSAVVEGIDLDLLLEDLAYTKKRVSELEDYQETIVGFLKSCFPKKANMLKKLLREPVTVKKTPKAKTVFMQEDDELSTEGAIIQCMKAKPVNYDPILSKVGIESRNKCEISASLGG